MATEPSPYMNLSSHEQRMLDQVKRCVMEHLPGAEVILYGSAARGERDSESDYDILVLSKEPVTRFGEDRLRDDLYEIGLEYDAVITAIAMDVSRWDSPAYRAMPFHDEVERDKIVL